MKKSNEKLFLLLLTLFLATTASCSLAKKTNTSCSNSKSRTLLWEIKSNSQTLYILGSIHIGSSDMYPLDPIIMNAFKDSDVLGVELDIKKVEIENVLPLIFDLSGNTKNILPTELYNKLNNKFVELGLPSGAIDKLKPSGIILLLEILKTSNLVKEFAENKSNSEQSKLKSTKSAMLLGIDHYFMEQAESLGKPIYEMETLERQIQVFNSLEDNFVEYLTSSLESGFEYEVKDIEKIITAWKNGDLSEIENLLKADFSKNEKINKQIKNELIYNRNIEMTKKIEDFLTSDKKYFIVVGAGHLVGEGSIIDLLQKTGRYSIRRL